MEKILLINPAQTYYKKAYRESAQGSIGLPLGILYVAAVLEKKGCRVRVIDSLVSELKETIKYRDRIICGIPPVKLRALIREFRPQIVGIASQFAVQEENVLNTAEIAKQTDDSIVVVVGGANASCRSRALLSNPAVDIVAKYEAENTALEIIDFYRGNVSLADIKGIAFHRDHEIIDTSGHQFINDLDQIPWPAYHLIEMERYLTLYKRGIYTRDRDVRRNISIVTSRGCPFNCIFCSISLSMGKAWRPHSADYVISHIQELERRYKVQHIHFEDDNLLLEPDRFVQIMKILRKLKLTWDTPNGIRVNASLDENILKEMARSGCKSLTIGVESGDGFILKNVVKKSIRLEDVEEFAESCKKVNLPLRAFFVLGFPGETIVSMQRTIDFALHLLRRYGVEIINLIATPLFGTELFRVCEKNGYFVTDINAQTLSGSTVSDGNGLIKTGAFSSRDVERMSRQFTARVYRGLFLRGLTHPLRSIKRVGNIYILKRTLKRMAHLG